MEETRPLRGDPAAVRDAVEEIIGFLLRQPLPRHSVRLAPNNQPAREPEIGLILQFIGSSEGEIAFLVSRETARAFIARLSPEQLPAEDSPEEMMRCKSALGELLNILTGRLLAPRAAENRPYRLTAPSCIFGRGLAIAPAEDGSSFIALDTPFGRFEFYLRQGPTR